MPISHQPEACRTLAADDRQPEEIVSSTAQTSRNRALSYTQESPHIHSNRIFGGTSGHRRPSSHHPLYFTPHHDPQKLLHSTDARGEPIVQRVLKSDFPSWFNHDPPQYHTRPGPSTDLYLAELTRDTYGRDSDPSEGTVGVEKIIDLAEDTRWRRGSALTPRSRRQQLVLKRTSRPSERRWRAPGGMSSLPVRSSRHRGPLYRSPTPFTRARSSSAGRHLLRPHHPYSKPTNSSANSERETALRIIEEATADLASVDQGQLHQAANNASAEQTEASDTLKVRPDRAEEKLRADLKAAHERAPRQADNQHQAASKKARDDVEAAEKKASGAEAALKKAREDAEAATSALFTVTGKCLQADTRADTAEKRVAILKGDNRYLYEWLVGQMDEVKAKQKVLEEALAAAKSALVGKCAELEGWGVKYERLQRWNIALADRLDRSKLVDDVIKRALSDMGKPEVEFGGWGCMGGEGAERQGKGEEAVAPGGEAGGEDGAAKADQPGKQGKGDQPRKDGKARKGREGDKKGPSKKS
ncbi:uncharacterized protein MKK02DRAFT_31635 [Dioszegia hungarica]|uniref:Uncharacterized protein n=1 Tax=Dioszegia hungarica TaxID=4972 RepID=A0AA38LWR7_9TREE|nr:uncharacterized protein MKK02DRAFT_31635 [Dioszegia hungarica]KAI9638143.1 hypothetical protein MKK02DRAFT_31635 [Dioszegia hungarica]